MINIEFGPSTILGIAVVCGGILLYITRTIKPEISRDHDIFFSSVALLIGGILIFQGWRLDPILLFGQMLSTGTALCFIIESLKLRVPKENNKSLFSTQNKNNSNNRIIKFQPPSKYDINLNQRGKKEKKNNNFQLKENSKYTKDSLVPSNWNDINISSIDYEKPIDYQKK
uniref:Uncharacterized protein ycf66 n=1 Tax=Mesostigma viride TaxID=41882 RepID=YCF66_MESVI|nr:hypothetical chloroplast RF66 [Mesostigma viride]Q9MUQ8.1 RecName: Full=Uncharacterized protein ycf66; Short=RF66 [Mesostigma viride]AAF43842.1 hypothetical chloroplast RF66 [Mesostigma viride]WKT08247.1 hypothetical chloroplast RF66 [Mesostigma viride]